MIPDIKSTNHQALSNKAPSSLTAQTGTISQLQSEIKLIKELSLIRVQGSETLSFQGKPAQLLSVTTSQQQPITLINTGPRIAVDGQQTATLTRAAQNQASLTFSNNKPNDVNSTINNLSVASRMITLTTLAASTNSNGSHLTQVSDGHNQFQIASQTPLQPGEKIRVLLDANNQLQVIPSKLATTPPQIDALKQSLPQQLSAPEMAQLIKQLQAIHNASPASLSPQSQRALAQLIQSLPALEQLTQSPDAMKQAIQTSGQFSESLLKNTNAAALNTDLKMNLTRLENATNDSLSQRSSNFPTEQVANAIERITTNQLRHFSDLNQVNAQTYPLYIELPIKDHQNTSLVQLQIDQEAQDDNAQDHERRWLVKLNFDFEETGRFEARAGIQENKVGILFAAEDAVTIAAIKHQMADLKQQLIEKNIEVQRLDVFQTTLSEDKLKSPTQTSLIDVRT
jgi:hypothetical protein